MHQLVARHTRLSLAPATNRMLPVSSHNPAPAVQTIALVPRSSVLVQPSPPILSNRMRGPDASLPPLHTLSDTLVHTRESSRASGNVVLLLARSVAASFCQ